MNPSEVLREAARVIESRGFHKGGYEGDDGVCLLGAINVALGFQASDGRAFDYERYIKPVVVEQFPGEVCWRVAHFNDRSATTKQDVVMVLEKAAVRAEETVREV